MWRRFAHLKLRAHLLDLRGLVFHHPRETRNSAFQFRDPLLLIAGFVEHGLRSSHLVFRVLVPALKKDPPNFLSQHLHRMPALLRSRLLLGGMVKSGSVRILVIEDEVKLATHLSRALESEGHEARVVHDGQVALVEAREGNYDLLVLDVELPRMDGFEILKELRSSGAATRILMRTRTRSQA